MRWSVGLRGPTGVTVLLTVPLSRTGAELLFELISGRDDRGARVITSKLPCDEWAFARPFAPVAVAGSPFGTERLTGALLERPGPAVPDLASTGQGGQSSASYLRSAADWPPFRARHAEPKVAYCCAARWPCFTPPLTGDNIAQQACRRHAACNAILKGRLATARPSAASVAGSNRSWKALSAIGPCEGAFSRLRAAPLR